MSVPSDVSRALDLLTCLIVLTFRRLRCGSRCRFDLQFLAKDGRPLGPGGCCGAALRFDRPKPRGEPHSGPVYAQESRVPHLCHGNRHLGADDACAGRTRRDRSTAAQCRSPHACCNLRSIGHWNHHLAAVRTRMAGRHASGRLTGPSLNHHVVHPLSTGHPQVIVVITFATSLNQVLFPKSLPPPPPLSISLSLVRIFFSVKTTPLSRSQLMTNLLIEKDICVLIPIFYFCF